MAEQVATRRGLGAVRERRSGNAMPALILSTTVFSLSQTSMFPVIPHLLEEFDTSFTGATWTLSIYSITAVMTTGLLGRLGDMFGKKRILTVVLSLFVLGSVICTVAPSLGVLIAGRAVMGIGGAIVPLSFSIARDQLAPERAATGLGVISATVGMGAGIGYVIGGLLVDQLGLRSVYGLSLTVGALALLTVTITVRDSGLRTPSRVDVKGAVLLTAGAGVLLLGISQSGHQGWNSPWVLGLAAAGLATLGIFAVHETREAQPIVHLDTFLRPQVVATNLATLLSGFSFFGASSLQVAFVQAPESSGYGFGTSAAVAGAIALPGTLLMLAAGGIAGRLNNRVGARATIIAGAMAATTGIGLFAAFHGSILQLVLWSMIMYVGIGLIWAALPVLILQDVPITRSGEATGMNTIIRYLGSGLGMQVAAAVLTSSAVAGAGGLPTEHGYVVAFSVLAIGGLVATGLAVRIPGKGVLYTTTPIVAPPVEPGP